MKFATLDCEGREQAAVAVDNDRWAPLDEVDRSLRGDMLRLIESEPSAEQLADLHADASGLPGSALIDAASARFRPPYRRPRKIWGIGLNYGEHAVDLSESTPEQPASFIKGDHTIIGPGDDIVLPRQSERVTAEAELGLIIGRGARNVDEASALNYVFGICPILDQTAEDILELNPRYLTRSKNFPTFFSFGPEIVTLDTLGVGTLADLEVATVIDGAVHRSRNVQLMTHSPEKLISFHSRVMPWYPGDVISTGTPGAAVIRSGAVAEARVGSMAPLVNEVVEEVAPSEPLPR